LSGAIGCFHSATVRPSRSSRTIASTRAAVTATPTRVVPSPTLKLTAASMFAFCAGPIARIGYQYWRHVFVSPGCRKEKSGWLSVYTPAISSMYGPYSPFSSASVRFRSQA
jgi:hypothetical protein